MDFFQPITFPYWEVHLEFKITGHGKDLFGDGMAFWYVKHPMQPGKFLFFSEFMILMCSSFIIICYRQCIW